MPLFLARKTEVYLLQLLNILHDPTFENFLNALHDKLLNSESPWQSSKSPGCVFLCRSEQSSARPFTDFIRAPVAYHHKIAPHTPANSPVVGYSGR